jgi:hypothetical protein
MLISIGVNDEINEKSLVICLEQDDIDNLSNDKSIFGEALGGPLEGWTISVLSPEDLIRFVNGRKDLNLDW